MFRSQIDYTGAGGKPTNTTYTGPWIKIEDAQSLAFIVTVPGASNPTAVFSLEVSNDPAANMVADANLGQPVQSIPLLATQATAANPAGAGVAIQGIIEFIGVGGTAVQYMPRAKWARLKYTVSGGGTTGVGLKISFSVGN